jgi:hypothetical protein
MFDKVKKFFKGLNRWEKVKARLPEEKVKIEGAPIERKKRFKETVKKRQKRGKPTHGKFARFYRMAAKRHSGDKRARKIARRYISSFIFRFANWRAAQGSIGPNTVYLKRKVRK